MHKTPLIVERTGKQLRLKFNRPNSLNAIDSAMAKAFLKTVEQAVNDESIRVITLSGEGRSFMAGGDIEQFRNDSSSIPDSLIEPMNQAILMLTRSNKIVLGSLQGPVAGAGMSIALVACDILIAAKNTRFSFAYTALAASGDLGISWMLPRLLGLRQAMAVALLGDTINAEEALRLGLVCRVIDADQLAASTQTIAEQLSSLPILASGSIKRLMQQALEQDLASQLIAEKQAFSECIAQPEFHNAVVSFLDKLK